MGADANICDECDWSEVAPDIEPNRMKCPECGAPFFEREVNRRFMKSYA